MLYHARPVDIAALWIGFLQRFSHSDAQIIVSRNIRVCPVGLTQIYCVSMPTHHNIVTAAVHYNIIIYYHQHTVSSFSKWISQATYRAHRPSILDKNYWLSFRRFHPSTIMLSGVTCSAFYIFKKKEECDIFTIVRPRHCKKKIKKKK